VVDYETLKAAMTSGAGNVEVLTAQTAAATIGAPRVISQKYSHARLQEKPLPEGVDAGNLELYLDEDEFPKVFGVSPAEFAALPKWKRDAKKKEKKLF
jgi:advillin